MKARRSPPRTKPGKRTPDGKAAGKPKEQQSTKSRGGPAKTAGGKPASKPWAKPDDKPKAKQDSRPPAKQNARPAAKPKFARSALLRLPETLLEDWRETLLELAKLPRGVNPKDNTREDLLYAIVKGEARAAHDLWEVFTQDRGELTRRMLGTKRLAVAYLLGFHLPNAARAWLGLERAAHRYTLPALFADPSTRLIWRDLGCGTGAAAQAVARFALDLGLTQDRLELELFDNTGVLLDAARALFRHATPSARITTYKLPLEALDLARLTKSTGDTVTGYSLGYVWNELERNPAARTKLLKLFENAAAEHSLLLLLEPANQAIARSTMALRDQLVQLGYTPLYPCPRPTPCPMLQLSRDWCYSEGEWLRPREMTLLDRSLGTDRSRLSGGLYVFASASLTARLTPSAAHRPVVVGRPERTGAPRYGERPFDYLICRGEQLEKRAPVPGKAFLARGATVSD